MARSSTYQEGGFIKEWIRDCLFGYIADHLDGMDDYFKECWRDVKDERGGIRYRKWLEECQFTGELNDIIGEYWYDMFAGREEEFKKFMEDIDFSGYVDQFKEDFEVNIVWCSRDGCNWLDIDVVML